MGKILKDTTFHRREVTVTFTAHEVHELLTQEAARIAGATSAAFKLDIRQETEGSPPYKIDKWSAAVSLTIDL